VMVDGAPELEPDPVRKYRGDVNCGAGSMSGPHSA
jgi:hypothetical protein